MFNLISGWFSPAEPEPVTFTTQKDLIERVRGTSEGLCGAFANEYARDRLNSIEPRFLREKDPVKVYLEAVQLDAKQHRQYYLGDQNAQWSAFKHFDTIQDTFSSKDKDKLADSLRRHNLIVYPTTNDYHMIYLEKENSTECRLFDANIPGGESKAPCSPLIKAISETAAKHLLPDGSNKIIVGATNGNVSDEVIFLD